MTETALAALVRTAPVVTDAAAAQARFADLLQDKAWNNGGGEISPNVRALLLGLADHAPFLWHLVRADPGRLRRCLAAPPEATLATVIAAMQHTSAKALDDAMVVRALRQARQAVALLVALADLGGAWDVVMVTEALTRFADAAVASAVRHLLRQAAEAGRMTDAELEGSGFCVLALGKHGARELNYSSDTDLLVLFDPATTRLRPGLEPAPFFVRLTQNLVRLLQERTPDGYVLRVDLRLRPDPGSTAIAIALPSAFAYYEMFGQNWERAAFIKARPVAGDLALGRAFIADLAPFVWRKYFDFAAIADIHAMKRQIHAVRGHGAVTVAGHDIKLGRGGIREIEFFVQTQQLIFGGRRPPLRGPRTLDMLDALFRDGWVTEAACRELSAAYRVLRTVEHRLQMTADEQTQRLPAEAAALDRFARFCGFPSRTAFEAELLAHLRRVERHYARLFENAPELANDLGSLVFTGTTDDPETLETLGRLGFREPAKAAEMVRGWHFGRRPAVRSARAREVLTDLVPALLEAFAGSGDPDAALLAFDAALARMPAAVELFALLKANARVRELFADILGAAPRLARTIAQRPHVLDAAIDPSQGGAPADAAVLAGRVARGLAQATRTEDFLDRARDIRQEEAFLIGLRMLSGAITPGEAAQAYTTLAEALIARTLRRVEDDFARDHGRVPAGACLVLGMGKLGSREMSAASDLDVILIYDFDADAPLSDGAKPLHAIQYYSKLTQRLIAALTVPTRRGTLYDVDLRLRPSGNKGPVATQVASFLVYQRHEAQTWEHLAVTRARVIAGDPALAGHVEAAVAAVLRVQRPLPALVRDVHDMRDLITRTKGEGGAFDLKIAPGGLIDVEFVAQFLVLAHAHAHPDLLRQAPRDILQAAIGCGVLEEEAGRTLIAAHRLVADVAQVIATCLDTRFDAATAPDGVRRRIAASVDLPDFATVERDLRQARQQAHRAFESVLTREAKPS